MRAVFLGGLLGLLGLGVLFVSPARADCAPDRFPCFGSGHATTTTVSSVAGPSSREIVVAQSYLGTNPTKQSRLWCADFMNLVEQRLGRPGTGSRWARSFLDYGRRVSAPRPGDIVVLSRSGSRNSGHVGYYKGRDKRGYLILVSGNHGGKVAVGHYPTRRVLGYVRPPGA